MTKLINPGSSNAYIKQHIVKDLDAYVDIKHPTNFFGTLKDYIKNRALYHFAPFDSPDSMCVVKYSSLPDLYKELILAIAEEFTGQNGYTRKDVRNIIEQVAKTSPVEEYGIKGKSDNTITKVYTPEEKFIAIDALKAMLPTLDEYDSWRAKIKKALSDPKYSDADRQKILDAIDK